MTADASNQSMTERHEFPEQLQAFKREHPDIAKALELFRLSMEEYRQVYAVRADPPTVASSSTNESYRAE